MCQTPPVCQLGLSEATTGFVNRLNQPNLFLAPSAPSSPSSSNLFCSPPCPLLIPNPLHVRPFHLLFSPCTLLPLFFFSLSQKMIALHIYGACISPGRALFFRHAVFLFSGLSFQELVKAMLFQIIQLLKLILG